MKAILSVCSVLAALAIVPQTAAATAIGHPGPGHRPPTCHPFNCDPVPTPIEVRMEGEPSLSGSEVPRCVCVRAPCPCDD